MKFDKRFMLVVFIFVMSLFLLSSNVMFAYDPDAVRSYNQGVDLSKNGSYQEAVLYFRKSITIDPSFTDAYYNLGSLYEYLGNTDKALEAYEELVKRDLNDDETAYKVATIYFQKNNYKKALSYLNQIPAGSSKYADSQKLVKKINLKTAQATTAEKTSTTAVTAKPAVKPVAKPVVKPVAKAAPAKPVVKKEFTKVVIKNFSGPTGIAKDSKNNLYVANYIENSIVQVLPDGQRKILAKGGEINGPIGLAVDAVGNIYVASYLSNEVLKIDSQGKILSVLKGINKPYYIFIDKTGILYISEQDTNTVIKLKL
jgi:tetratricopeptide (TPR) repeat protein